MAYQTSFGHLSDVVVGIYLAIIWRLDKLGNNWAAIGRNKGNDQKRRITDGCKQGKSESESEEMAEYRLKIPDWPKDERPRERAIKRGLETLSDAELLGILIAKGTKEKTAIDLARELLVKYDSLRNLSSRSLVEYSTVKGVGDAKAVIIGAAFEISRRVQSQKDSPKVIFKRSQDVADYYLPLMRDLKKEVFKVALLDGANKLIKDITVSEGTLNTSVVHPREVFRDALIEATAGVVLVHNHPSGDPTPSEDDITITKQLVEAGKIFGIKVFDHIIVAQDKFQSFADEGLI